MAADDPHLRGALCYPAGALFGPVPMALVLALGKGGFTRRCAAQALCGFAGLLVAAAIGLFLVLGGLLLEVLAHGTASFDDSPHPPPIVAAASTASAVVICGTYAIQVALSMVFAARASRGRVTLFPIIGAPMDRVVTRSAAAQTLEAKRA